MDETVFRNARLVLADTVIHGDLSVRDGMITAIDAATHTGAGEDLEGDWLVPGLIELHTDHLESHYAPRPGVRWNPLAAVQAHDAQIAASGITTVFDALRVGMDEDARITAADMRLLADAIEHGQSSERLRADHFIHLRCEVSAPDVIEGLRLFEDDPRFRLASLMDHTPGQRQFTSLEAYRIYYQGKTGMSDAEFKRLCRQAAGARPASIPAPTGSRFRTSAVNAESFSPATTTRPSPTSTKRSSRVSRLRNSRRRWKPRVPRTKPA